MVVFVRSSPTDKERLQVYRRIVECAMSSFVVELAKFSLVVELARSALDVELARSCHYSYLRTELWYWEDILAA